MPDPVLLPPTSDPSRWRHRLAAARPEWAEVVAALAAAPVDREAIVARLTAVRGAAWRDEAHLRQGLRFVRAQVYAAIVDRDLAGAAPLAEVMGAMTALAEIAVDEALGFLSRALAVRHGIPRGATDGRAQDLLVVGMGKLGGGELNVSSDIDLIFLYAEEGETAGEDGSPVRAIANAEFFARLGRQLMAVLGEVTADGFVFRVDMRLRPDGDSGPLVAHFAMLERYLLTSARDWERFAWVKARVVSGPVFATDHAAVLSTLDRLVTPFVYRRYLDFGAIDALRKLHRQIREEAVRREAARAGRSAQPAAASRIDVKLGRGGIREVEFIAQHHQLIRGGRETALRLKPTVATLEALVEQGLMARPVVDGLLAAYRFLRQVEHRVQYLDDAQTHVLPPAEQEDDRSRVARMCASLHDGAPTFDALVAALTVHRERVAIEFEAIFGDAPSSPDDDEASGPWAIVSSVDPPALREPATVKRVSEALAAMGYASPETACNRLLALAQGVRVRTMGEATRTRLDALMAHVIAGASVEDDATATLGRWLDLIEAVAGRSAYLALLDEYPVARAAVTRLLAASPWAAQYLTRHPILLDDLIEARGPSHGARDAQAWRDYWGAVADTLNAALAASAADAERQMDLLRETQHAETFRLLLEDLEGRLSVESLSDQLSALTDLVLQGAIDACWASLRRETGDDRPAPRFAAIAYGKLGGKELGYASDLDLVYLYDEAGEDGDPGATVQRYVRFAQRLTVWLTTRTTAGALFEIDLRLRPDGAAGLVVTSVAAWSRYQRREHDVGAWTWEHQALTRARFAAGDPAIGRAFEAVRLEILSSVAPDAVARARVRTDVIAMRKKMHDGHPNRSGLFDLKHDPGGMVDIEFSVQYLALGWGHDHPELLDDVGNIALLGRAAALGLVDADVAQGAANAYRTYRARQHAIRLAETTPGAARVAADSCAEERAVVRRLWDVLFGRYRLEDQAR